MNDDTIYVEEFDDDKSNIINADNSENSNNCAKSDVSKDFADVIHQHEFEYPHCKGIKFYLLYSISAFLGAILGHIIYQFFIA